MEGWTEAEIKNKDLLAPCGLYCGTCPVYVATRDGHEKLKKIMGNVYGRESDDRECLGCMQPEPAEKKAKKCKICPIKDCIMDRGFYSCHQCHEWPCEKIENFKFPVALNAMKRAIPHWREQTTKYGHDKGSIEWARSECRRYHCSSCGKPLFRGALKCRACGKSVADELDGRP